MAILAAMGAALVFLGVCVCVAALRQSAASARLARGAELELADREVAAVADDGAAPETLSRYHWNLFI